MPTLEQLFNNGTLTQGPYAGQVPKDAFYPKNSNKIELSSNSPVINSTAMKALNKLRANNGSTLEETLLEQETTGIRILSKLSSPLLYGFESGRITLRTTKPLTDMKLAANGELSGLPIVGKAIKSVQNISQKVQKFLGIPELATPTYVVNSGGLDTSQIQSLYIKRLQSIKSGADGTAFGGLVSGLLKGQLTDPDQLKKKAITGAIGLAKGFLRDKIVGGITPSQNNYDYTNYPAFKNGVKVVRNYGSSTNTSIDGFGINNISSTSDTSYNALGAKYSSFFLPRVETDELGGTGPLGSEAPPLIQQTFISANEVEENREFGILKNTPFPDIEKATEEKIRNPKLKWRASENTKKKNSLEQGIAGNYSSYTHFVNRYTPYTIGDINEAANKLEIDSKDIITLKFESIKQNKAVNFLSTITGLNESFSPSWSSGKFIGNPFNFYTYDGIERSVSFSFKVFSLNPTEHKAAWDRLNFLTSLVYPQAFEGDAGYITAPFLRLTLGDMYIRKEGFLESLSYGVDDSTPWETQTSSPSIEGDVNLKGYKLPKIINVETTFKFIEQRNSVDNHKYYPFAPITN